MTNKSRPPQLPEHKTKSWEQFAGEESRFSGDQVIERDGLDVGIGGILQISQGEGAVRWLLMSTETSGWIVRSAIVVIRI